MWEGAGLVVAIRIRMSRIFVIVLRVGANVGVVRRKFLTHQIFCGRPKGWDKGWGRPKKISDASDFLWLS